MIRKKHQREALEFFCKRRCHHLPRNGVADYNISDFKKAIADFIEALRLKPNYVLALRNRASAYYQISKNKQGAADEREIKRLLGQKPAQ